VDPDRIDADVTGAAAAHQRLLADLDRLTDDEVHRPSLLPKWTVGHVVNHIFRNAEGMIRVFEAAGDGRVVERYHGGVAARDSGIEDGADRPADELVGDVRTTIWRLEQAWAGASFDVWRDGLSLEISGRELPARDLVFRRWREVEVHHADLGLDFTFDDWSDGYVARELEEQLPRLPARLGPAGDEAPKLRAELGDHRFVAWLLGRWSRPDLPDITPWQ
jgi:maleylpyruvate isomerase